MDRQIYKISKFDWLVTLRKCGVTYFIERKTKKEAVKFSKEKRWKGYQIQLFKVTNEFRQIIINKPKKGKK